MSQSHEPDPHRPPPSVTAPLTTGDHVQPLQVGPLQDETPAKVTEALDRLYECAACCDPIDFDRGPDHDRKTVREHIAAQAAELERLRQPIVFHCGHAETRDDLEMLRASECISCQIKRDRAQQFQARIQAVEWTLANGFGRFHGMWNHAPCDECREVRRELDRLRAEAKA